ncbi:gliding motility-associated C-terminal domain-containing protein [Myroides ceti]|uniref:Gliding motility-associated C-terminal domain-containing protein n=1 Tax=Paenimyroides ceti TaxID=395087 RepID=A0ABT8CQI3_9FLAO|nr:gliding motility-associated C-terminal domain-containing protein [Paenimyroides ceti]MDN3705867.1 gliding motility-associated C-terminal domain-containing protein [Paenimyroides ceti]
MKNIKWRIIWLFCLISFGCFSQTTISAGVTPVTCTNNGTLEITLTDGPVGVTYGIVKAPFDITQIVSSNSPLFTMLESGLYYFGYYEGTSFVKADDPIYIADYYNSDPPVLSYYKDDYYAYCQNGNDPLGSIYAYVYSGNGPYTISLLDISNMVIQEYTSVYGGVNFNGLSAGTYRLKAEDECGTVVYTPTDIIIKANIPYTDFSIGYPSNNPNESYFEVLYNNDTDGACSGIRKAGITSPIMILGRAWASSHEIVQDITTMPGGPKFYGDKYGQMRFKFEVQNESGAFDVYDDLTYNEVLDGYYPLPDDRSEWGIIRLTFKICGIEKTNSFNLANYSGFKVLPVAGKTIYMRDNPDLNNCDTGPGKVLAVFDALYPESGCPPFVMKVTDQATQITTTDTITSAMRYGEILLDIGKTYTFKITDASGAELTHYLFYNQTSASYTPSQSNPASVYINPAYYTPKPIRDKLKLVEGPSIKKMGKTALVLQGITNEIGLTFPVTITSVSGPSSIYKTIDGTGSLFSTYFLGLGDDLLQGNYTIKVKDSGCFEEDFTISLVSYISDIALQNVTYTPDTQICDRYVISGEIKISAVGRRLGLNPDAILEAYGSGAAYPRLVSGPQGLGYFYANGVSGKWFNIWGQDILPFTFTANISGDYVLAISPKEGFNTFVTSEDIMENTLTVPITVSSDFPIVDLSKSGGAVCGGSTTGDLYIKVDNATGPVTYFLKKSTDAHFPATGQSSPVFTGLSEGSYQVKIVTRCYQIIQPFVMANQSANNIIVGERELCKGDTLDLSPLPVGPLKSIEWKFPDGTTTTDYNLLRNNMTAADNGTYSIKMETLSGCVFTQTVNVTVYEPDVITDSNSYVFCVDEAIQINFNSSDPATTYLWTNDNTAGGIAASGSGSIFVPQAINHTSSTIISNIRVVPVLNGCEGMAVDIQVKIFARGDVAPIQDMIVCDGDTVPEILLKPSNAPDGTGYFVSNSNPSIGLSDYFQVTDDKIASFVALNDTNTVKTAVLTIQPYVIGEGCGGASYSFTITVKPKAVTTDIIVNDETICKGEDVILNALSNLQNPVFKWYSDPDLTTELFVGVSYQVMPAVTTKYYVTVSNNDFCENSPNNAKEITVTVREKPTVTNITTACSTVTNTYTVAFEVNGIPPFIISGTGSPGSWTGNKWTSSPINNGTEYDFQLTETNGCDPIFIKGNAPDCCELSISCLPSVTVSCGTDYSPVVTGYPTIDSSCGGTTISYIDEGFVGGCSSYTGTFKRQFTVEDANGNIAVCFQQITVEDTIAPVFAELLPADIRVSCDAIPSAAVLTATDECGSATVMFKEERTDGSCSGNYILTRTWTATDECGNSTQHVQIITVEDTTAPVFAELLPADITVSCDAIPPVAVLTATDDCGSATVMFKEERTDGSCSGTYILTRTWIATDECGNSTQHVQIISFEDTTAPFFAELLPADIRVSCDAIPSAAVLTATDDCGSATVMFKEERTDGSCSGNYTLTRTWTATDDCSNSTQHIQIITVQDTTAPFFAELLPADITVSCDSIPSAAVLTATDDCGSATVMFKEERTDGSCSGNYILTRTWTATDECGNSTQHVQIISVEDTTAPVFAESLPADITVSCDSVPSAAVLTATDDCGLATVMFKEERTDGSCSGNYILTRTWTATDDCSNSTQHIQIITVQDTTAPFFAELLPADITVSCDAIPPAAVLTATDDCGLTTVMFKEERTDGSCSGNYILTRTWTATDDCGNSTQHVQIITVEDTTAPEFTGELPTDIVLDVEESIPAPAVLIATDDCGSATVMFKEERTDGSCSGNYILTRTWTATDDCGNSTEHVQVIIVEDTKGPEFIEELPTDMVLECGDTIPEPLVLTTKDKIKSADVVFKEKRIDGSCPGNYVLIRTWTATDNCGNETIHQQTITIRDTINPEFIGNLPEDAYMTCDQLQDLPTNIDATDGCGTVSIVYTEEEISGDCSAHYTLLRTWTATDTCGNSTSYTQRIEIACKVEVFNAVSADGDGINDVLEIQGIECYPDNSVEIFNRWGELVYATKNYNSKGNVFSGYSNKKENKLVSGTYYYIIRYEFNSGNGNITPVEQSGFIHLQTN